MEKPTHAPTPGVSIIRQFNFTTSEEDGPTSENHSSENTPAQVDEVVVSAIAQWKTKLIDVSKRNRALNVKPTPVTTVRIIDEYPPQVFKQVVPVGRKVAVSCSSGKRVCGLKNPPESHPRLAPVTKSLTRFHRSILSR